ncbi:hypothetical protein COX93_02715 [Candidatus Nomurabacteria bacterium CG_4_10_14_0_2_um_filter_30_12]|uniref:Response regulatory domain-containing protein n=3 Tax=Candidatus Nomuraibacteriota TaxID=1752729 RepID=A0A1J4UYV0_9BACT|nr:MAG: hypothetical protein AUJ22_00205 [Candidatus Nomurabacteria bacterium CG1_02_31_12]PIR69110.1 MAG: hypothetical protein COU48_00330 [Candidatus Nomurabacteria bacterium CG10_big_fil_rev_8_21_14_0_10_03_31_7]PIZ86943.1 MAG: hypothetical protein COX93_02715 [Candidatus Nomurabacteria bacterium CG_4_10_14_0_2_um_filter_30_12]
MKNVKTLLIDSDEHSRYFLSYALKKSGIEYLVVLENGFNVLEKVKNQQFDLILTELMVSGIGGFELIKKIRSLSSYKDVPIIVVTTLVINNHIQKCFELGATDFIAKPFNLKDFIEKIKFYSNHS